MRIYIIQLPGCMIIVLMLLATAPLWAQQQKLAPRPMKLHHWYVDAAEAGGGASQHGVFMGIELMSCGVHWPKPFGVSGTLIEVSDFLGQEGTIFSLFPFGISFPIMTVAGRDGVELVSLVNLTARAHLFNGEVYNMSRFPPFFDVCLEWRNHLNVFTHDIITLGYRRQMGSFECKKENLDVSGIFAGLQVAVGGITAELK